MEPTFEQRVLLRAAAEAEAAAQEAHLLRKQLRWSSEPGSEGREKLISGALDRLDQVMKPVRSAIGRLVWEPQPEEIDSALRAASAACGRERKQLKKMRR